MELLQTLKQRGLITDLDIHFTQLIDRLAAPATPGLALAALLASHETGAGNVCVNLPAIAGRALFESDSQPQPILAPDWPQWGQTLRASPVVGAPGERQPLILDRHGRLYLYRYWDYEQRLARHLLQRADVTTDIDLNRLAASLGRLFTANTLAPDWQQIAAAVAALRRLCVISGGPGTGKTTTVIRILALLLEHNPSLRIGLAAPTGKAAARMQEAIRFAKQQLDLDNGLLAAIPEQAATLHRLLGPQRHSVYFRHDSANPLPLDVLVVDEASMVDLALMTKLVEALPPSAHLILLGDKDQLASVEAGAVLGDICGPATGFSAPLQARLQTLVNTPVPTSDHPASAQPAGAQPAPAALADSVVLLRHSYRFGADSGIGALARAVNQGQGQIALNLLRASDYDDIGWQEWTSAGLAGEALGAALLGGLRPYVQALREGAPAESIFNAFNRFRVLCALRNGPCGVEELNRQIAALLHARRLIRARELWYPGRPVMITHNDYNLRLYNGDIGIALPDPTDRSRLHVVFQSETGLRRLPPNRLPEHETVYAMTIHKSQGSEFERVLLLLPPEPSRILSRELLYTGITRARAHVEVWGTGAVFIHAVTRRLQRTSGLREALWG